MAITANIDVLDRRRTGWRTGIDACFAASENRVDSTIIVDETWSIHRICSRIRRQGQVGVLRTLCHGGPPHNELGTGMSVPGDTIDFRLLRNHWFGAYHRIEIHGCGVASATPAWCEFNVRRLQLECVAGTRASNSPGMQLVQAMAYNAGVLVIADLAVQRGDPGFEGSIVHCRPAVSYTARDHIGR